MFPELQINNMTNNKVINTSIDYIKELIYKKIRNSGLYVDINISINFEDNLIIIDYDKISRFKKIIEKEFILQDVNLNNITMNLERNISNILNINIIHIEKIGNNIIKLYLK